MLVQNLFRTKWTEAKKLLAEGINPGEQKKQERFEQSNGTTFKDVARAWHANNKKWSNSHTARLLQNLAADIFPAIGETDTKGLKARDLLVLP